MPSFDGWVCVNKPYGMTSAQAVGIIRRALNRVKAGHSGTLDPLATGVLPIALGQATKAIRLLVESEKEYRFRLRWGIATDTADVSGAVVDRRDSRPSRERIMEVLPSFLGRILQTPPAFSAVKIKGRRAYSKARQGEEVTLSPRFVDVSSFILESALDADQAEFRVTCGKGVYIRSLAVDLAQALDTVAHVTQLERRKVGFFTLDRAFALDRLPSRPPIHALEEPLNQYPSMSFDREQVRDLRRGLCLPSIAPPCPIALAFHDSRLFALIQITRDAIIPLRIFHPT